MTEVTERAVPRFATRPGPRGALALVAVVAFALVLTLVATQWAPLRRLDVRIDADLNAAFAGHAGTVSFWRLVSTVGQPLTFETLAVVGSVLLWIRGLRRVAVYATVAVIGGVLLDDLVKAAVDRARPVVADPVAHAHGASFPSGHATASWVAAVTLTVVVTGRLRRVLHVAVVAVAFAVAALVGFSRLALGVHYPSDVLGAWLLGTAWVLASSIAFGVAAGPVSASRAPAPPRASDRPRRGRAS